MVPEAEADRGENPLDSKQTEVHRLLQKDQKGSDMNENESVVMCVLGRNWGRWLNAGGPGPAGCGSIERRYVAPRPDEDLAERVSKDLIDDIDAENFETAVSAMRIPGERDFLVHWFVYERADSDLEPQDVNKKHRRISARWGIDLAHLDAFLIRCLTETHRNLAIVEMIRSSKNLRVRMQEVAQHKMLGYKSAQKINPASSLVGGLASPEKSQNPA